VAVVDCVHGGAAKHSRSVEQQKPGAAGRAHGGKIGVGAGNQCVAGEQRGRRGALDLLRHSRRLLLDHGGEQRLLVGKVVIERAAGDAGSRDNLGCAGLGIGFFGEQFSRCRDQVGACRFGAVAV